MAGSCSAHDVLFHHRRAEIVYTVSKSDLSDLRALGDPGCLEALDVIKEEATKDCKAQEAEVVVEESSSTPKTATELYAAELANMRL